MRVRDELPCCLIFNETIDIYTTGEMDDPTEETMNDGKTILWNWTFDRHVVLHDEDILTIEFYAKFVQYCECINENWAYVEAWGCSGPTFKDNDDAEIDCTPQDTTFEKTVWNGTAWTDYIETARGNVLRFKIELKYFGEGVLNDIRIVDILPCILLYDDNVEINEEFAVEVSDDSKTIWFNSSNNVSISDGDILTIKFDAYVEGTTEGNCDCEFDAFNFASITARIDCAQEPNFYREDEVEIHSIGNCPPSAPGVTGDETAKTDEEAKIKVTTEDSDNDQVYYMIRFGDGETGDWIGPYNSSDEIAVKHVYDEAGTYEVTAKAKDIHGAESDWSYYPHIIKITQGEEPDEGLEITFPGLIQVGTIVADIENVGDEKVYNVSWNLSITKDKGLFKFDAKSSGEITSLDSDKSKEVECPLPTETSLKIGRVEIKATAEVDGDKYTETEQGFIIGKIVILGLFPDILS